MTHDVAALPPTTVVSAQPWRIAAAVAGHTSEAGALARTADVLHSLLFLFRAWLPSPT